nr:uroporphyrinogen-III synthase [Altericroceibacterium endophyticum]
MRPEPGFSATIAAGRHAGLPMAGAPLSQIRPLAWSLPDVDTIDALLMGSANAIRQGGAALDALRGKPVLAVGKTTAEAARNAGFTVETVGEGGLQNVLDALPSRPRRLLRLAGAEHVPLALPDHIHVETRILYENALLDLPHALCEVLGEPSVILLHSAATARHFAKEVRRCGLPRDQLALACLGPRISEAAGEGWARIGHPVHPRESALLALAQDMCHDPQLFGKGHAR